MTLSKQELDALIERTKETETWSQYELEIIRFIRSEYLRGDTDSCKGFFTELFDHIDHKKASLMALFLELFPETLK